MDRGGDNSLAAVLLSEREMRSRYVPSVFTDDCPWFILLDLYRYQSQQVSSLCYGSGHPYTTALRHLLKLTEAGFVERMDNPDDGRQVLCQLSESARDSLTDYLSAVTDRRAAA